MVLWNFPLKKKKRKKKKIHFKLFLSFFNFSCIFLSFFLMRFFFGFCFWCIWLLFLLFFTGCSYSWMNINLVHISLFIFSFLFFLFFFLSLFFNFLILFSTPSFLFSLSSPLSFLSLSLYSSFFFSLFLLSLSKLNCWALYAIFPSCPSAQGQISRLSIS